MQQRKRNRLLSWVLEVATALIEDLWRAARHPLKTMLGDVDGRTLKLAEWYCDRLDDPRHTSKDRADANRFFEHNRIKIAAMAFDHHDRDYQTRAQALDKRIDHFRLVPNKP